MSKENDAIQYSRAIHCNNLTHLGITDLDTFLRISKEDWNLRAGHDASSYVCASPRASEEQIRASGKGDVIREFIPRINGYKSDVIVELGAGFGRMTMFIAPFCKKLYAIDISGDLLFQAKQRLSGSVYQHVEFIETDGMHLNTVPDNSVDLCYSYIVFQHIVAAEIVVSYIHEACRVLKVGGVFVFHGRDVNGVTDVTLGNTWHGFRLGSNFVRDAIQTTSFKIIKEEGQNTDRYWCTLKKEDN